jgi:hypothetical protein
MSTNPSLLLKQYPVRRELLFKHIKCICFRGNTLLAEPPAAIVDQHDILASVPVYERPAKKKETTIDLLLRLDCWIQSGLTQDEFGELFAKCRCGLIKTRRAFRHHTCAKTPQTVIDLTMID